jgi:hypothetical protein
MQAIVCCFGVYVSRCHATLPLVLGNLFRSVKRSDGRRLFRG